MHIIDKFSDKIKGVLSGFDRIIIKGHFLKLFSESGKMFFLWKENVLLKDFASYAENIAKTIKGHVENMANALSRPLIYLNSSKLSKEGTAKSILKDAPVEEGLICILSSLEMNNSLEIRKNAKTNKLELRNSKRKCLHYYFYFLDKEFGFIHVKLQTWFPFGIQVYINGREYIAKQLDKAGITYLRYDNSFTHIDDIETAQKISDDFVNRKLDGMLNHLAEQVNPILPKIKEVLGCDYYWCVDQCEYATDIMFNSRSELEALYTDFVEHAIVNFKYNDVMTFMGRKMHHAFSGEIVSDIKTRPCGVRIKHRMKSNSIKMYDKCSVLRVETTINGVVSYLTVKSSQQLKRYRYRLSLAF